MKTFENRYGTIYLIQNLVNGKRYIGKTVMTVEKRWWKHCSQANKNQCPTMALHSAIRKYGRENFSIVSICSAKEQFLCELEKEFIQRYGTKIQSGFGYNMTDGGDGMSGHRQTEETKRKRLPSLIGNKRRAGRKLSIEEIEHLQKFVRGIKKTPKQIEAMSLRESSRWNIVCRNGHLRTESNTRTYTGLNGRTFRECQDCRKSSPSRTK